MAVKHWPGLHLEWEGEVSPVLRMGLGLCSVATNRMHINFI